MSAATGISWTDRTWNPVVGCAKVSQGCKNCYAKTLHDMRHKAYLAGKLQNIPQYAEPFEAVQMLPGRLADPLRWRKPSQVFVNSMSDLFHEDVSTAFLDEVFSTMALCDGTRANGRRHTFQVLTKRPERALAYLGDVETPFRVAAAVCNRAVGFRPLKGMCDWRSEKVWPLPNVWLGVSVENQAAADERIPLLLQTPAAIRFLSCEPLLGAIDLFAWLTEPVDETYRLLSRWYSKEGFDPTGSQQEVTFRLRRPAPIDWIIVGGESGKGARPMHPDWARSLRDQCIENRVPFHFKQWGEYREFGVGPELETTFTGTVTADTYTEHATKPVWLDLSGNVFSDPDNLPEETPCRLLERVGTKRAGRELDGRTWDEFPAVAP